MATTTTSTTSTTTSTTSTSSTSSTSSSTTSTTTTYGGTISTYCTDGVYDLTTQQTVLTYTNSGADVLVLQGVMAIGDGADDLDGTGGEFELTTVFGSRNHQPDPELITFDTVTTAIVTTHQFPLPVGETVTFKLLSPNAADTSVYVRSCVIEVGVESIRDELAAIIVNQRTTRNIYDDVGSSGGGVYPNTSGSVAGVYVRRC